MHEFNIMTSYCQIYQKVYNNIASKLKNNNRKRNQNIYYKNFLQGIILEKLFKTYVSLVVTIDTK